MIFFNNKSHKIYQYCQFAKLDSLDAGDFGNTVLHSGLSRRQGSKKRMGASGVALQLSEAVRFHSTIRCAAMSEVTISKAMKTTAKVETLMPKRFFYSPHFWHEAVRPNPALRVLVGRAST